MSKIAIAAAVVTLASSTSLLAQKATEPPPIIRTVRTAPPPITYTQAPQVKYGAWVAQDLGDYTEAFTGNESGSSFGILCGQTCVFYVDFQTACDNGDDYPAMLNSDQGAMSIVLKCHHIDTRYVLSTDATTDYIGILEGGGEIGFAIPLQGGRFNVSRFSTDGGLRAVALAIDASVKKQEQSQDGLRDFTI